MIVDRTVTIVNPEGLHARPSAALAALVASFESELRIQCRERNVNARSILELITLGATCGSKLRLRADGVDAEGLVQAVVSLVQSGFSELG